MKELEDLIDWKTVMAAPRYAGGHEEVMRSIFGANSAVIAWWSDNDYQGTIAIAHQMQDGRVVVMTDYYGSCSGCDAWEDATDDEARNMILNLVHNARAFSNRTEAASWCRQVDPKTMPQDYPFESAVHLADQIQAGKEE